MRDKKLRFFKKVAGEEMSEMGGKGNWGETWDWSAKDFLVAMAVLVKSVKVRAAVWVGVRRHTSSLIFQLPFRLFTFFFAALLFPSDSLLFPSPHFSSFQLALSLL